MYSLVGIVSVQNCTLAQKQLAIQKYSAVRPAGRVRIASVLTDVSARRMHYTWERETPSTEMSQAVT